MFFTDKKKTEHSLLMLRCNYLLEYFIFRKQCIVYPVLYFNLTCNNNLFSYKSSHLMSISLLTIKFSIFLPNQAFIY